MKLIETYSPGRLYAVSQRWTEGGFTVQEAVQEYMLMHPKADEATVLAEVERVAASGWEAGGRFVQEATDGITISRTGGGAALSIKPASRPD